LGEKINNEKIKFKDTGLNWKTAPKSYYFPPLRDLTLMQTPNTIRCCYMCRGKRFVSIEHQSGKVTLRTCMQCKGSGSVLD